MKEHISILKSLSLILLAGALLTSCEKDKDDPVDNIIGTWTAGSVDVDAMVEGKTLTQYFTEQGYTADQAQFLTTLFNVSVQQSFTGTITFNSDGTYTANLGQENDSGTWSMSADNKELTIDSSTESPVVLTVESLTSDELRVSLNEEFQEDLNDDDVPETITATVNMTFNK